MNNEEIVYDSPDKAKRCPIGFRSANGGQICLWENEALKSNTPILDSLTGEHTEFPAPKTSTRLDREKSLTELFGGPI